MKDLWNSARSLWIKFCGIADEYKMLRDRWLYLYSKDRLPVLPYLKAENNRDERTFDLLDAHVEELERKFRELGFDRNKMESYKDFGPERGRSRMGRIDLIDKLKLIEDYVYDLANFVGLLKFAFFQRTVSSEIPHVASGMPHSPERTIGNELFYLAADNVANRYYECLNIPYGKWDGFITFVPPIKEGYFYGAFCYPSPYLELFHVSMSEEAKYFLGSYLALAHEFGHAVLPRRIKHGDIVIIVDASWSNLLFNYMYKSIMNKCSMEPNKCLIKSRFCEGCPVYKLFTTIRGLEYLDVSHSDVIADIVGVYIGGINVLQSFLDFIYNTLSDPTQVHNLIRVATVGGFLKMARYGGSELIKEIERMIEDAEDSYGSYYCPDFYDCVTTISSTWAATIHELNKEFERILFEGFEGYIEDLVYKLNPFSSSINTEKILEENLKDILNIIYPDETVELIMKIIEEERDLISTIVVDRFKIKKSKEKEIVDALIEGTPIPEEDPRHILHCYYEAYRQSEGEERPNYAATIYSLAFNTFNQNKKNR